MARTAMWHGYDGLILKNVTDIGWAEHEGKTVDDYLTDDYAVFSPEQIKSAEPVVRDDAGNVIPLSERFNEKNPDIRFREAGGIPANEAYENEIRKKTTNILMEFQDGDIPVRIAVNNIMNEVDKRHLADDEDYLTRHNLVSSMADAQMHKFKLFYYEPLVKAIGKIEEKLVGKKAYFWNKADYERVYGRVKRYIYAVSALERNAWKRDEADRKKKDAIDRLLEEKAAEISTVRSTASRTSTTRSTARSTPSTPTATTPASPPSWAGRRTNGARPRRKPRRWSTT